MATKQVKKTVAFWEIRDQNGYEIETIDWQRLFSDLEQERIAGSMRDLRHTFNGAAHYAQIYAHNDEDHLVIARERDEPPSSLDLSSGEIIDAASGANRPWVEISAISFMSNSNVFGFVLGSMASPRAGAVADWLNSHEVFEEELTAVPHVSEALIDKLADSSSEARLVHLTLDSAQINAPLDGGGLYSRAQQLGQALDLGPEVEVEVVLRIAGRVTRASEDTRRRIADLARDLINRPMRMGKVEVVDVEGAAADRDLVDLIKHSMTTKMKVSVMDDEGRQVRIPSALNAISRAASHLQILRAPAIAVDREH